MAEEYLNINPPEGFQRKDAPVPEPPKENRFLSWIKGLFTFLILVIVVVVSFWISFQLGKNVLMPVRKISEKKIEAPIPEPPESIRALQRLREVMSKEAMKKARVKAGAKVPVKPKRKIVCRAKTAAAPVVKAAAGKHYYKVQAGWFADKSKADELAGRLKASGFDVFLKKVGGGWRIQAGAYKTKSTAEVLRRKLKEKGFDSSLIYE